MTFSEKLQRLRKGKGMSQEQLAAVLMVSRQAVSKWETGESLPDAGKLVQLSRLFGVSVDILLKEELLLAQAKAPERQGGAEKSGETEEEPPMREKANKPKHTALLVVGTVLSALGVLGFAVIWVLSTMIEGFAESMTVDINGMDWHYTAGSGYSFSGFMERYRLQAVCILLGAALIAGMLLLVLRHCKRHKLWIDWRDEDE